MKKEIFSLKINVTEINIRYGIVSSQVSQIDQQETKDISIVQTNLEVSQPLEQTSAIEEILKAEQRPDSISFLDINKKLRFLYSSSLDFHDELCCHWCTFKIVNEPIGCPIRYEFDKYVIDGVFCSFNCCYSYILDHQNQVMYRDSITLLHNLYLEVNTIKTADFVIHPAPHWKMLKKFGGKLTEMEFKRSFGKEVYTKTRNFICPVAHTFEKREIF